MKVNTGRELTVRGYRIVMSLLLKFSRKATEEWKEIVLLVVKPAQD